LAFRCPQCHFEAPEVDVEHNPSTDRWLKCPACGHRWNVSPIADSN
jgi:DNA-directed RNA polymerase subunit RPC12/RpoP